MEVGSLGNEASTVSGNKSEFGCIQLVESGWDRAAVLAWDLY